MFGNSIENPWLGNATQLYWRENSALALAHISNVAQHGYFSLRLELLNTLSWSQSYFDSFINILSHQCIQLANTHRRATQRCLTGSLKSLEGAANQWSQGREGGLLLLRRNLTSRDVRDQLTGEKLEPDVGLTYLLPVRELMRGWMGVHHPYHNKGEQYQLKENSNEREGTHVEC